MTTFDSADGITRSVLVTPQEMTAGAFTQQGIVVVVSNDCIAAVDAARKVRDRAGVFIGELDSPALTEMRDELYEFR